MRNRKIHSCANTFVNYYIVQLLMIYFQIFRMQEQEQLCYKYFILLIINVISVIVDILTNNNQHLSYLSKNQTTVTYMFEVKNNFCLCSSGKVDIFCSFCMHNSSFVLNVNSFKLCMIACCHMKVRISSQKFDCTLRKNYCPFHFTVYSITKFICATPHTF